MSGQTQLRFPASCCSCYHCRPKVNESLDSMNPLKFGKRKVRFKKNDDSEIISRYKLDVRNLPRLMTGRYLFFFACVFSTFKSCDTLFSLWFLFLSVGEHLPAFGKFAPCLLVIKPSCAEAHLDGGFGTLVKTDLCLIVFPSAVR